MYGTDLHTFGDLTRIRHNHHIFQNCKNRQIVDDILLFCQFCYYVHFWTCVKCEGQIRLSKLFQKTTTIRSVAQVIGFLVSSFPAVEYAEMHYRHMEPDKKFCTPCQQRKL